MPYTPSFKLLSVLYIYPLQSTTCPPTAFPHHFYRHYIIFSMYSCTFYTFCRLAEMHRLGLYKKWFDASVYRYYKVCGMHMRRFYHFVLIYLYMKNSMTSIYTAKEFYQHFGNYIKYHKVFITFTIFINIDRIHGSYRSR